VLEFHLFLQGIDFNRNIFYPEFQCYYITI